MQLQVVTQLLGNGSIGATVVGMNAWWTGPEMLYALNDSEPKAIILDEERLATFPIEIRQQLPAMQVVGVRLSVEQEDVTPWQSVIANPAPIETVAIDPDSDACIFYTSGHYRATPRAHSSPTGAV